MGWGCTVAAGNTLDALTEKVKAKFKNQNMFEVDGKNYFFEVGREQPSGAITGSLIYWAGPVNAEKAMGYKAGTFKINPDGTWARIPVPMKKMLEVKL